MCVDSDRISDASIGSIAVSHLLPMVLCEALLASGRPGARVHGGGCAAEGRHHLRGVVREQRPGFVRRGRDGLPLRLADLVVTSMATLAAAYLAIAARWVPGWGRSFAVFVAIALGPLVLRALPRLWPKARQAFDFAASFWLLPASIFGHAALGPIADGVRPALVDRQLAALDISVFGRAPAVLLEGRTPPWLTELLLVCYYTYFLWPVLLGVLLYFTRERKAFDEYLLALSLLFSANFVLYVLVPAVGPRYFLAGEFRAPLQGVWLTPFLDSLMRQPAFARDCFPSGHTAVTALTLAFAHRHHRRFFWALLPVALGLIAGTVVGRFHYVVDLIFAMPLLAAAMAAAVAIERARPSGVVMLPLPEGALRRPAGA